MAVRQARPEDVPRLAEALAEAFSKDPPMRWVMGESPRAPKRLRRFFAALLPRFYMRHGEVWVSDGPVGVAAWARPGAWSPPAGVQLAAAPALVGTYAAHPLRAIAAARESEGGHPAEAHWFLDYIAVEPGGRRRGTGGALMAPVLERCDAERVPAFLNAGSERSRDLYSRHGFDVLERFELPLGGPPLWRMWREPRASRA